MTSNRSDSLLKLIYIAAAAISCFGFSPMYVTDGLDSSWSYAATLLSDTGSLWGSKVIFTCGPLGKLLFPFVRWRPDVSSSALLSLAFWSLTALAAGALYTYIMFSRKMQHIASRRTNITASLFMLYVGSCVMKKVLPEYVPLFLIMSLLYVCWYNDRATAFFAAAALTVLSGFIRFNLAAAAFIAMIVFTLISFAEGREHRKIYLAVSAGIPVVCCACFLLYNPSLSELVYYIRGMYEISSGYNSAMSLTLSDFPPAWEIKMYGVWLSVGVMLMVTVRLFSLHRAGHSLSLAALLAVFLFFMYKHCVVRIDSGMRFGSQLMVYASVYVLFMRDELTFSATVERWTKILLCVLFCGTLAVSALGLEKTVRFEKVQAMLTNPLTLIARNLAVVPDCLNEQPKDMRQAKTPEKFIDSVCSSSTAVYPIELSHVYDFPDTYRIMPVLQAYSAYTSWLDSQDAKFFADDERAPHFVIFSIDAIDDRFPLIESPAAWLEIFRHYRIASSAKTYIGNEAHTEFLLERSEARKFTVSEMSTQEFSRDDVIFVPEVKQYCLMRVNMPLSLIGSAVKVLWKIPRVDMEIEFLDGRTVTKRVLPEVFRNLCLAGVL